MLHHLERNRPNSLIITHFYQATFMKHQNTSKAWSVNTLPDFKDLLIIMRRNLLISCAHLLKKWPAFYLNLFDFFASNRKSSSTTSSKDMDRLLNPSAVGVTSQSSGFKNTVWKWGSKICAIFLLSVMSLSLLARFIDDPCCPGNARIFTVFVKQNG